MYVSHENVKWNHDECGCERKQLVYWSSCKDDYIQNLSTSDFECDKTCRVGEYLDIINFVC